MATGLVASAGSAPGSIASSPYRVPIQLPRSNSRKSPPMAFEKTPNDSLAPLISPPENLDFDPFNAMSPTSTDPTAHFQAVIDKQSNAIEALHAAFAAEREAWAAERRSLYQRVSSLEKLLRAQNGHSPAKSPIISPHGHVASPQSCTASTSTRLPSIIEDENLRPLVERTLSERREHAPRSISIPIIKEDIRSHKRDLSYSAAAQLDELGVSPPRSSAKTSPPPLENVANAGHTPLKTVRPPTPPPKDMTLTGAEDTPTRNNTHINALLTQSSDEEEDIALNGPLNMPELPGKPSAHNFTEDMLVKKLEMIAQDPQHHKPTIFSIPSPGLAIAEEDGFAAGLSPQAGIIAAITEGPLAPVATRDQTVQSTTSPRSQPVESITTDTEHDHKFEQGGIRLKKKPSTNFGAPFGQLSGFAGLRKMS